MDAPKIWSDGVNAPTKQERLATLIQYIAPGMTVFRCNFLVYADLLRVNISLYNFVVGDRFINPGDNSAYLTGGLSMWITLQGYGFVGDWMVTADSDIPRST